MCDHEVAAPRDSIPFFPPRDKWWQDALKEQSADCPPEWMGAEDPLFRVGEGWAGENESRCGIGGGAVQGGWVRDRLVAMRAGVASWGTDKYKAGSACPSRLAGMTRRPGWTRCSPF